MAITLHGLAVRIAPDGPTTSGSLESPALLPGDWGPRVWMVCPPPAIPVSIVAIACQRAPAASPTMGATTAGYTAPIAAARHAAGML
jgi:hypothetical protein